MILTILFAALVCVIAGFMLAWGTSLIVLKLTSDEYDDRAFLLAGIGAYSLALAMITALIVQIT
jgi:hypothetical protein